MEQVLPNGIAAVSRERAAPLAGEGVAVLIAVLGFPIALYLAGVAHFGRLLYPAINLLLAGYLFSQRSPWYAAHCVLLFCFVSLVRRLVDAQAGFDASNPVLLTPYLCCGLATLSFLEYWSRPNPQRLAPFLVLFACIGYGTALALLDGRLRSSLVDVLKWGVGPLFAVYLLANRERIEELRQVVEPCLIGAGVVMALYGIGQFIDPAQWDAIWVRGVADLGFESIGRAEPFQLRVFSTMNSPGAFGTILSVAILLALKQRLPVCLFAVAPMMVGLALCQYRSVWAATILAIVLVALSPSTVLRRSNLAALFGALLLLCSTAFAPQVRDTIVDRAATLSELEGDESLRLRLRQYEEFLQHDNLIVGDGLAINGASRRLDNKQEGSIDGAVIEIYHALGVFVGTAFIAAIVVLIWQLFVPARRRPHLYFDRAIVFAMFVQFPIGTVHVGELGFCAWAFLGFALAEQTQLETA